jgi:hypothetical protein
VHGRLIRFLFTAAALIALAWAARRALIRWIDGPTGGYSTTPWGPIPAVATAPTAAAPAAPTAAAPTAPTEAATPAPAAKKQPPLGAAWVAPDDAGACPEGHPVKVKLSSRLYHLPGMNAYARTRPDRCYPTAEAAEADGYTRAKR